MLPLYLGWLDDPPVPAAGLFLLSWPFLTGGPREEEHWRLLPPEMVLHLGAGGSKRLQMVLLRSRFPGSFHFSQVCQAQTGSLRF